MLSRYKDEKDRLLKVLQLKRVYLFYKKTLSRGFSSHLQFTLKFKFYFNKKYSCTISILNKQFKIKKSYCEFQTGWVKVFWCNILRHLSQVGSRNISRRTCTRHSTMVSYYRSNNIQTGKRYLDSPIRGRVSSTAQDANYWGPVTVPSPHNRKHIRGLRPLPFTNSVWVL